MFEGPAFGRHTKPKLNNRAKDHQHRCDQISDKQGIARPGTNDPSEEYRRTDSAGQSPHRVKNRDRKRANFERENFTDRQISRAGGGRGDKENNRPRQRLGLGRQQSRMKKPPSQREQDSGDTISRGDHLFAADRVEQMSEHYRTEHVSERKRQQITTNALFGHPVKSHQDESVGKKDRVVEKRLRQHQDESKKGTMSMFVDDRVPNFSRRSVRSSLDP